MTARYGSLVADRYGIVSNEVLLREWSEALGNFSSAELRRGMDEMLTSKFPPTLPEFMAMCRPSIDPYEAFMEVIRLAPLREIGQNPKWSHPAIYWAMAELTFYELRQTPYQTIKTRWERALKAQLALGVWEPIPRSAIPLPSWGGSRMPATVREQLAPLIKKLTTAGGAHEPDAHV